MSPVQKKKLKVCGNVETKAVWKLIYIAIHPQHLFSLPLSFSYFPLFTLSYYPFFFFNTSLLTDSTHSSFSFKYFLKRSRTMLSLHYLNKRGSHSLKLKRLNSNYQRIPRPNYFSPSHTCPLFPLPNHIRSSSSWLAPFGDFEAYFELI